MLKRAPEPAANQRSLAANRQRLAVGRQRVAGDRRPVARLQPRRASLSLTKKKKKRKVWVSLRDVVGQARSRLHRPLLDPSCEDGGSWWEALGLAPSFAAETPRCSSCESVMACLGRGLGTCLLVCGGWHTNGPRAVLVSGLLDAVLSLVRPPALEGLEMHSNNTEMGVRGRLPHPPGGHFGPS